jgi:KaiC/GvpD/RAD55 family RecA-like ATPase
MSDAPALARIVEPAGQPARPQPRPITEVSALPSVWDLDAKVEWLVPDMIPRASVNLISAESGTGKTWLAYAIAGAVAHGSAFIGRAAQSAPVLYLDGENPLYVVKRNLGDLGIPRTDALRIWGGWNTDQPPGPEDDRIVRFATEAKPLLVWDSLVEFAHADEQSSTEMREFLKHFRRLAHGGATIIILHHTGKTSTSKDYRGSSDIKAAVDTAYRVTGRPRYGKLHRLDLDPFKSRIAPGQKVSMEFHEGRGFVAIAGPKDPAGVNADQVVRRIVTEHPGRNASQIKDLAQPLGVPKHKVDELLCNGEYAIERGKGAAKVYTVIDGSNFPISAPLEKRKSGNQTQNEDNPPVISRPYQ